MTLRESYVSFCGGRLLAGRGYGLGRLYIPVTNFFFIKEGLIIIIWINIYLVINVDRKYQ